MVEYTLLLVVALSLVLTFYNSDAFRRLFGEQGSLATTMKKQTEFSYRHAFLRGSPETDLPRNTRNGGEHPSYHDPEEGSRFFGARDPYPL